MNLQSIKVSACYESETNPRGAFNDAAFKELVASVKEKGVLVPVLVRQRKLGTREYEVIAGSRRLRAANEAGLNVIPANVVEMTDVEAREAQIVENLQRADVHPLEEGEAYRQLIEDGGRSVEDISVKVGKSESYVRQRLFLTNLSEKSRKLYRSGKMADSVAILVARLAPNNQDLLLKDASDWDLQHAEDIKDEIAEKFSDPLKNQPWLNDKEAIAAVGPCKECPPNRAALFGNVKEGQCTDLRCYTRKFKAYITWRIKQDPELVLVTTSYGKPDDGNVIARSRYEVVKKNACDFATEALVAEGEGIGSSLLVCFDKDCKKHRKNDSEYETTDKERAKRKKEREQDDARRKKFDAAIATAVDKVKWPLSEKHLDAIFDLMLENASANETQPVLKRHGLKAVVKKSNGYSERDFKTPLRELAEGAGKDGKLRMIFEFVLPTYWSHGTDKEMLKKVSKL